MVNVFLKGILSNLNHCLGLLRAMTQQTQMIMEVWIQVSVKRLKQQNGRKLTSMTWYILLYTYTGISTLAVQGGTLTASSSGYALSESDRESYEKVFSSFIVPYNSVTVGKEIGQGKYSIPYGW